MTVESEIRELNYQRLRAVDAGREVLDRARAERRAMTGEEEAQYQRSDADIDRIDRERERILTSDRARHELETVNEAFRSASTPRDGGGFPTAESRAVTDFFRPGPNAALDLDLRAARNTIEAVRAGADYRDLRTGIFGDTGASGGSLTVPTTVANTIYSFMTAQVSMRRMRTTKVVTDGGNPMAFPRTATHAVGTQIANQDTTFTGTDPVLGSMTLNAYDFGEMLAVGNDLLEDTGTDVLGWVASQLGRAIGQVTATGYVTGSGSSTIQGIQGAIGGAGTIATGGSLILGPAGAEVEKLIDLQYSVADSYRANDQGEWLMRDSTGARVRKLRDGSGGTTGAFIWQPSQTVGMSGGQPDRLLGDRVYFDPNVSAMGSDAKIMYYGDWSSYFIRDVKTFRLERSTDFLFGKNQTAYRALLRTDGDCIDTAAINVLHQAVT